MAVSRVRAALRQRRVRVVVGVTSLLLIPLVVPFLGLTTTYGKAQLSQAPGLVDLLCASETAGGSRLRCDAATALRSDSRRDDWWVLGYVVLGATAALCLTTVRSRSRVLGSLAVAFLAAGGAADLVENAKLRASMSARLAPGGFDSRDEAIAAVGDNPDATVLFGWCKTGLLAVALLIVVGSLFRRPQAS